MARLKRSSKVLEKGLRRMAGMRSINDPLDFAPGLSLTEYDVRIQALQGQLARYNTMLSTVDEMAGVVKLMEEELRSYSEKMLMGVVTRYGKDSLQYVQAGGTPRKRTTRKAVSSSPTTMIIPTAAPSLETNGNGARVTAS
ncbi:MAG: hypothetical protein KME45_08700 [Stenomitos rutilans HA7619-LM2]|jgi:hypothetical protein|nr:hypothetical protein [Stenomitos rutilans HA7619-LM2]